MAEVDQAVANYCYPNGDSYFDRVQLSLTAWAEDVPFDYPGDDLKGYSECQQMFEDLVMSDLEPLLLSLDANGYSFIAQRIAAKFNQLADLAMIMDQFCYHNPCPEEDPNWPSEHVAESVGDPHWRIFNECYEIIRQTADALGIKPAEGRPKDNSKLLPKVELNASSATIYFDGRTYANVHPEAAALLQKIIHAYPLPIGLTTDDIPKPYRILDNLPPEIKTLIKKEKAKGATLDI